MIILYVYILALPSAFPCENKMVYFDLNGYMPVNLGVPNDICLLNTYCRFKKKAGIESPMDVSR